MADRLDQTVEVSIIDKAQRVIEGCKRSAYGPVEESFARIANIWSGILGHDITAKEVALMMTGLKLHREANKHSRDNLVDIHGYVLLVEKLEKGV